MTTDGVSVYQVLELIEGDQGGVLNLDMYCPNYFGITGCENLSRTPECLAGCEPKYCSRNKMHRLFEAMRNAK